MNRPRTHVNTGSGDQGISGLDNVPDKLQLLDLALRSSTVRAQIISGQP